MHPSAPVYLRELRRLAEKLFETVHEEFATGSALTLSFDRVDDLADRTLEEEHLTATVLLCAQLLHRVTARPEHTRPRQVLTLTTIIDQVLPPLAFDREPLLKLCDEIGQAAFTLATLADPDAPDFSC